MIDEKDLERENKHSTIEERKKLIKEIERRRNEERYGVPLKNRINEKGTYGIKEHDKHEIDRSKDELILFLISAVCTLALFIFILCIVFL